jgi:beta-lactamase superfamily II metal-dependent hydrolase
MGELHHLDVGCADASVIKTATTTFLIDCERIGEYGSLLPPSKVVRGVFITHQHRDHFSGLEYLRRNSYRIEYLIYSPYERRRDDNSVALDEWQEFEDHRAYFERQGTKMYRPFRQASFDEPWWNIDGLKFEIIGPHEYIAKSETRELHDANLVIKATLGTRACLFTGDASDTELVEIAATTTNFCNDILHASHHGSINGADLGFIKKCNAQWTVISTATGVHDNVPHPDALRRYIENTAQTVYRTDKGSIRWSF